MHELSMDLDVVLRRAVGVGASDVHLKVGQPPVIRKNGELVPLDEIDPLDEAELEAVLDHITADARGRRELFDESGELDLAYTTPDLPRFRVNGFRQRGAISFAFRVISDRIPDFAELNLPPGVGRLAGEQRGLVLVTGATGSGKTTTLAAMIDEINRTSRRHIVTIEDPIEVLHHDRSCIVNQREVGIDTESFAQALRRVLRQDPDVILIGELRDAETAQVALQAAESGHLVFSTLHTLDAAETIGRIVEFFPHEKQSQVVSILAGVLRGVVSQRLLPRVGGGRIPAVEVMVSNARIAELIRERRTHEIPDAIERRRVLRDADLHQGADRPRSRGLRRSRDGRQLLRRIGTTSRSRSSGRSRAGRRSWPGTSSPPSPGPRDRRAASRLPAVIPLGAIATRATRGAASEQGYTLIELVTVMAIVLIVMTGLTTVFTSGVNAELRADRKFQAQQNARIALDRLRSELHCASAISAASGIPCRIRHCHAPRHLFGRGHVGDLRDAVGRCESLDAHPDEQRRHRDRGRLHHHEHALHLQRPRDRHPRHASRRSSGQREPERRRDELAPRGRHRPPEHGSTVNGRAGPERGMPGDAVRADT